MLTGLPFQANAALMDVLYCLLQKPGAKQ